MWFRWLYNILGIRELGIEPYDEDAGTGDLRYVQAMKPIYIYRIVIKSRVLIYLFIYFIITKLIKAVCGFQMAVTTHDTSITANKRYMSGSNLTLFFFTCY